MSGFRRFLSLFLALAMCVSLLPVSALAEEEAAVEALSVEELTELVEPEETPELEITEEVEETADPEVTGEPAATEAPVETEEPEETEIPAETAEPEETETPAVEAEQESETLLATSGTCGDNLTWTLSDDGVLTISGTGAMMDYYEWNVPWYSVRDRIKLVVVENNVTSIGNNAFYACGNLISVTMGDSLTTIGYCAFFSCDNLTSVTIPDSVTSIDHEAFLGCSSLTSVTIGDSLTSVGDSAFGDCESLTSFSVSKENSAYADIEGVLFNDSYTKLICYPGGKDGAYVIPDSVTTIWRSAFYKCNSLTSVTIPDSVTIIGLDAFYKCTSLTSVTIPDSVTTICSYAFAYCNSLTSVTIGDGVTTIGDVAFYNCDSLKSVTIPDSVTTIGRTTFGHCDQLKDVTIPDSVTTIGRWAFQYCVNLADVYYKGSEEQWREIDIYDDNEYLTNATIHYNYVSPFQIVPGENAWAFSNSTSSFGKRREGYEMTDSDFMRLLQNLDETDKWLINIRMFKPLFKLFNINIRQKWGGSCYGMSTWVCLAEAGVVDAADIADKSPLGEYECTDIVESAINYYHMQQYISVKDYYEDEFRDKSQQEQLETLESLAINASETGIPVLVLYSRYKSFDENGNCETGSYGGHAVVAYGVEEGDFTDYVYERMELKGRQDAIMDEYEFTKRILIYDCSNISEEKSKAAHIYYTEEGVMCIPAWGFISTDSQTADTKYNNGILTLATNDTVYLDMVNYNTGDTSNYYKKYKADVSANALYTSNSDHSLAWGDNVAEVSGFTVSNSTGDKDIRVVVFADATEEDDGEPATKMIRLPEAESYTMETEEEIDFQLHCGDSLMAASAGTAGTVELQPDGGVYMKMETAADYNISITANEGCADMTWNTIQLVGEGATDVSAATGEDGVVISGDILTGVRVVGRTGEELADLYFTTEENSVLVSEDDSVLVIREDADKDGVYEKEIMSSDIVGDVNGSGTINCVDLVSLMKYLVGMTEDVAVNKCDMNGDDNINIQDAVCLVKTLATDNP